MTSRADHNPRRLTVDRLAVDGLVQVFRGARVPREELDAADGEVPVITARHVRDGALPAPAKCPRVPADMLERRIERTEPGDVLVLPEGERIHSAVVKQGGAVAAAPLWVLRPRGDRVDSTYLAACLASEWNTRHTRGTTIPRANVRDLEVPLLPLAEQRQLALRVRHLQELHRQSDRAAALARSLCDRLVDGVAAGVLTVEDPTES